MSAAAPFPYRNIATINDPNEVRAVLKTLTEIPEYFDIGDGEQGLLLKPDPASKDLANREYKISIGPLEIVLDFDPSNWSVSVSVRFKVPFDGTVTLANIVGNLKEGISLKIGYPPILGGIVGLKLNGTAVVFSWDFTVLGKQYKGEKVLFNI
ncbi:hypothetical protein DXG01_002469 [Tephrocybe rancida]|nr:hypothetical protein DXG01_002469 [Tephrocybe rancida]